MIALLSLLCLSVLPASLSPGDHLGSVQADGESRDYRLHLPACYNGCRPLPVILAFHGMSANAKLLQRLIELDESASKYGFITVYPEGTGLGPLKGFKAGASTQKREERKPDDVRFVNALLDKLERTVCIDSNRVYATGLSNGAMMCYRLAVDMPHRLAAIAPVSGGLGTQGCLPKCPISVLHFHGTCDDVLPFNGPREKGILPQTYYPVPRTIQLFAEAAGVRYAPEIEVLPNTADDGTSVCIQTHLNHETGAEVVLVKIVGGGHQWPMHPLPFRYLGRGTTEIDANDMMCQFFLRHSLAQ